MEYSHKTKRQALVFEGGSLRMKNDETASLKEREVLIKVAYAPITNFDKNCLSLQSECEGRILGSEGSGIIQEVGKSLDASLKGKKVAFCHNGWTQFVVKDFDQLIVFDDKVDLRMAATSVINPLTALSIKYMMLDRGIDSFIFLGANSTLGHILMKIAIKKGLKPIGIVEDKKQLQELKNDLNINESQLLSFDDSEFDKRFQSVLSSFKPRFLIDAVGSERSGVLFERMPASSEMILLGNLSKQSLSLNPTEFFMHNKRIRGFNLTDYARSELSDDRRKQLIGYIKEDIDSGGEYFGAKIAKEFRFAEDWGKALDQVEKLQDQGKVLLAMQ